MWKRKPFRSFPGLEQFTPLSWFTSVHSTWCTPPSIYSTFLFWPLCLRSTILFHLSGVFYWWCGWCSTNPINQSSQSWFIVNQSINPKVYSESLRLIDWCNPPSEKLPHGDDFRVGPKSDGTPRDKTVNLFIIDLFLCCPLFLLIFSYSRLYCRIFPRGHRPKRIGTRVVGRDHALGPSTE